MDIRTESRNVTMVPQWQEEIEGRLHDLQDGHNDILHARMILERNRHHNKGPKVTHVPGEEKAAGAGRIGPPQAEQEGTVRLKPRRWV